MPPKCRQQITNLHSVIFQRTQRNLIFNAKDVIIETVLEAASHACDWSPDTIRCIGRWRHHAEAAEMNPLQKKCKFYFSSHCVRRCSRCMRQIHDFAAVTAGERRPHFVLVPHPRRRCNIRKDETRIRWHRDRLLSQYSSFPSQYWGTAVAQWLRCCATNQKVAGSIPAGVIRIFHWHKILPIALWPWGRLSL